jgi:exopolyphosphatase / guanosine-5'-triphosphate,3'-diphosphate pyrophosphatase
MRSDPWTTPGFCSACTAVFVIVSVRLRFLYNRLIHAALDRSKHPFAVERRAERRRRWHGERSTDGPVGGRPQASMERLAAVDVGTNTVRLLVADVGKESVRPVHRERRITGLGRSLRTTGAIGDGEFRDTIAALRLFRHIMDTLNVVRYRACGTAALREAKNRGAFIAAAEIEAGIRIDVVTAREEALRTREGIDGRLLRDRAVIMDIGGGSTEFIAGPGRSSSISLPIGVVVVCSLLPLSDPPAGWQIRNMRYFLGNRITAGTRTWTGRRYQRIVGTAGTLTTLAAIDGRMAEYRPERIDGWRIPLSRLRRWEEKLYRLTDAERLALPGMEKGRERSIVPGVCLAVLAMEMFGADDLVVSDAGILEGIIKGIAEERENGDGR